MLYDGCLADIVFQGASRSTLSLDNILPLNQERQAHLIGVK